jgi:hypothetical protein
MTLEEIWNSDETVADKLGIGIPAWVEQEIGVSTVASIVQSGCNSGSYMPAVTYWQAIETMAAHGDNVLQYIEDVLGELPSPFDRYESVSWGGMAVFYLSHAVELWASDTLALLTMEGDD